MAADDEPKGEGIDHGEGPVDRAEDADEDFEVEEATGGHGDAHEEEVADAFVEGDVVEVPEVVDLVAGGGLGLASAPTIDDEGERDRGDKCGEEHPVGLGPFESGEAVELGVDVGGPGEEEGDGEEGYVGDDWGGVGLWFLEGCDLVGGGEGQEDAVGDDDDVGLGAEGLGGGDGDGGEGGSGEQGEDGKGETEGRPGFPDGGESGKGGQESIGADGELEVVPEGDGEGEGGEGGDEESADGKVAVADVVGSAFGGEEGGEAAEDGDEASHDVEEDEGDEGGGAIVFLKHGFDFQFRLEGGRRGRDRGGGSS